MDDKYQKAATEAAGSTHEPWTICCVGAALQHVGTNMVLTVPLHTGDSTAHKVVKVKRNIMLYHGPVWPEDAVLQKKTRLTALLRARAPSEEHRLNKYMHLSSSPPDTHDST